MSELFPTFARFANFLLRTDGSSATWRSTPWWLPDTLVSQQQGLLRLLSVAVAEQLELAPLLRSFAYEHRGRYRRRLLCLAQHLDAGVSLPDALAQTPGTLADAHRLAIQFGIQSGVLDKVLQSIVQQPNSKLNLIRHRLRQLRCYAVFVGVLLGIVLSFIVSKIFPSLQLILRDFSADTTQPFQILHNMTGTIVSLWPLLLLALALCVWIFKAEFPTRLFRRHLASRIFRSVEELRTANLFDLLAIAARAGHSLPESVATLGGCHYDSLLRKKLRLAQDAIEQGGSADAARPLGKQESVPVTRCTPRGAPADPARATPHMDCWHGLAVAGLLSSPELRALENSTAADSTVWTLRQLADWKNQRALRIFDIYVDLLLPVLVVLLASLVLLTALATMTPLFKLIYELS